MGEIRTFRDLIVWQKSMTMVTDIYRATGAFPREELFGLTSQMRRCAVSIPSNIAEGYGRQATGDYIRFLQIALGSLYELQTQVEIANNLNYFNNKDPLDGKSLLEQSREVERMLKRLLDKLKNA